MAKTYLATVHVIIQVEDDQCPEDAVSELLRVNETVLDWCYDRTKGAAPGPKEVALPDGFEEHDLAPLLWPKQLKAWRRSLP